MNRQERRAKANWIDPIVKIPGTDISFYTCAKCGAAVIARGKQYDALDEHKAWHGSLLSA